jgi:hypothetical protein
MFEISRRSCVALSERQALLLKREFKKNILLDANNKKHKRL